LKDSFKEFEAQTSQTLKEFMQLTGQSTNPVSQEISLEDTLEAFRQTVSQCIQELKQSWQVLKDANTQATARLEE
jgi:biotin operon repressor